MLRNNYLTPLIFLFFVYSFNLKSQSHSQVWPTIEMTGKVNKDLDLKFKYRNKYDFEEGESTASWVNFGISYDIKDLTLGLYYRELSKTNRRGRYLERRPYVDISYEIFKNFKVRLRNAFRFRENYEENLIRNRFRVQYSTKLIGLSPFILNEIFMSNMSFNRNRVGIGFKKKIKKTPITLKPSYIIEFFRNDETRGALLLSLEIKF